jgi:hypothetical protein
LSAQQSPLAQQNPFWQWPLTHCESALQVSPSGSSGTHTLAALQYALASHSASDVQLSAHSGGFCTEPPVQVTDGYGPQVLATCPAAQAVSSATPIDVPHVLALHTATSRSP